MYYKVLKDNKVIDVLDHLSFVKFQEKNGIMLSCKQEDAQAILSSDCEHIWHVKGLYHIPVEGYDTVSLKRIDVYEYEQLKALNMKDAQSIIDEYTILLIKEGII